ncbi:MAG: CrcB family protein [Acidimicrobiales bacterium]|jgi:CrcB protein
MILFLVVVAGAVGCVVRFLAEYVVRRHNPTLRPWATVAANAVGCGIAGLVAYRLVVVGDAHVRSVLLTGFCGGLTTFSSAFAIPAMLQREHHLGFSVSLVLTTPLLCWGFFALGMSLAH